MARPRIHKTRYAKKATVNITFVQPGQKAEWAKLLQADNKHFEKNLTGLCRSILMQWAGLYGLNEEKAVSMVNPSQVNLLEGVGDSEKVGVKAKRKKLDSSKNE